MPIYDFYEIKTEKSGKYENGFRQVSLSCSEYPGAFFFLWINKNNDAKHIQLFFDEKVFRILPRSFKFLEVENNDSIIVNMLKKFNKTIAFKIPYKKSIIKLYSLGIPVDDESIKYVAKEIQIK